MTLTEAARLAHILMLRHGLIPKWSFRFDRAKERLGCCRYKKKEITLSAYYVTSGKGTVENVTDTLLHEIAHALVGSRQGHNDVWKRKCLEIGAKPKRCGPNFHEKKKFGYVCPNCSYTYPQHRRRRISTKYVCTKCTTKSILEWRSIA